MDQSLVANGLGGEGGSFPCQVCNKNYASISSLMEHQRTHTGERPYACTICNKRFTQKAHLIIHKRTHTGERPYACHICHKRFAQSSHLNSHKRIHTGEKPYFCSICNVGFCRKPRMEAHILQHVQEGRLGPEALASLQTPGPTPRIELGAPGPMVFKVEPQDSPSMVPPQGFEPTPQGASAAPSMADIFPAPFLSQLEPAPGQVSSSLAPSNSSHRRKPSFVRRVNNGGEEEEESQGNGGNMDYSSEDLGNQNLVGEEAEAQGGQRELEDGPGGDGQSDENDLKMDWPQVTFIKPERLDQEEEEGEDPSGAGDKSGGKGNSTGEGTTMGGSGDEGDNASMTSDSNLSVSDLSIPNVAIRPSLMTTRRRAAAMSHQASYRTSTPTANGRAWKGAVNPSPYVRTNSRISLVDFTAEDLLRHMMSRDDVHHCEFCCLIFQDPAMYHLHRSMHDKADIRCCNLCGKLLQDKYDFTAHFLTEHKC